MPDVSVLEHSRSLTGDGRAALKNAAEAVVALSSADVTIIPYARNGLWGSNLIRLAQLLTVHGGLRRRTVSVLHDVYHPGGRRGSEWWAVSLNTTLPRRVVIHGEHDRLALAGLPGKHRASVIPHFIEERAPFPKDAARAQLGVSPGDTILGIVGWIHPRKNYELSIRALARLEDHTQLWFVGGTPTADQAYLRRLLDLAAELGLAQRVFATGYVSEHELQLRLSALDVGLCPYHDASASGSMSTLLSARRPVVASDVALARELRQAAPAAIRISSTQDPEALAAAVRQTLESRPSADDFTSLLTSRSPAAIAARYLQVLRDVARKDRE